MSSTAQRKRRTTGTPLLSRANAKSSRTAAASRTVAANRTAHPAPPTETIDVLDGTAGSEEDVVDLTCEGSEPAAVVDLTNNDSVVVVDEGPQRQSGGESYIVCSDEDEEEDSRTVLNAAVLSSLHASSSARVAPGTISCPVCMDCYSEIVDSGRLVVSTRCGHVFCSQCLRDALSQSHSCPTCRKKLTPRQYHPIYI
ncbi:E3 ubiquitin-protein ligase RNF4 [Myripristis murdjan]|uniref:RING-type domain-containing protein n=1 Tax=Myripristis murdjan TaxID=586833 RepID=A0A667Z7Q8_9TELE|nr:E3 ubiquitin-protein ligase RNF4 [Myripristis murdjan]XP_029917946.1 E3 ubiquitin-protein ligase RNF4 [Myripristis murdjan]